MDQPLSQYPKTVEEQKEQNNHSRDFSNKPSSIKKDLSAIINHPNQRFRELHSVKVL